VGVSLTSYYRSFAEAFVIYGIGISKFLMKICSDWNKKFLGKEYLKIWMLSK
jgi:hypothetical protein